MKNKEKFKDEIVNIICCGDNIAVNKKTYLPTACSDIKCSNCLFYGEKLHCVDSLVKWSGQEYKDPHVISFNDSLFLGFIKDKFEYIVRDQNGALFAFVNIPEKSQDIGIWIGASGVGVYSFNIDFPMIKWTDEQPWKISDLKKLKIVKKY